MAYRLYPHSGPLGSGAAWAFRFAHSSLSGSSRLFSGDGSSHVTVFVARRAVHVLDRASAVAFDAVSLDQAGPQSSIELLTRASVHSPVRKHRVCNTISVS